MKNHGCKLGKPKVSYRLQSASALVLMVFFLFFVSPAWSQPAESIEKSGKKQPESTDTISEKGEPIHINSSRLEVDNKVRKARFIGQVIARQGDITLHSDELLVIYGSEPEQKKPQPSEKSSGQFFPGAMQGEQIKEIVAIGHVRLVQGDRTAEGEKAVFYNTERKIVLTGNPIVRRADDYISGERITLFIDTEISIVEGKAKDRVQAVIYPGKSQGGSPLGIK